MFTYQSYCVGIHSKIELPELEPADSPADITVRIEEEPAEPFVTNGSEPNLEIEEGQVTFGWKDIGLFRIARGESISIRPLPDVPEQVLRLFILGSSLGIAMTQRAGCVFHASVVGLPEGAVAFVGEKGYGKSTMAASLHVRGHEMISDDLMVLDEVNGEFLVRPGFPQVKLWPDSAAAIGDDVNALPLLHPNFEKRQRKVQRENRLTNAPLRAIYMLGLGEEIEITPLPRQQAMLAMLPHWYGARYGQELIKSLGMEKHFQNCHKLATRVPGFVLRRPASLEALPEIARRIEEHVGELAAAKAEVR